MFLTGLLITLFGLVFAFSSEPEKTPIWFRWLIVALGIILMIIGKLN